MSSRIDFHFSDFTESHYRELLAMALDIYRFVPFTEFDQAGRVCLWRHDVDFSPQRAKALASIEASMGVTATYFINIHSEFYNAQDEPSSRLIREILGMGHRLGLHFDAGFYSHKTWTAEERLPVLRREKDVLETLFGVEVGCYSIHNPTVTTDWNSDETMLAGMVNAYCRAIASRFTYVSDSNGIWWRGRRLADILADPPERLHLLTHPEWWPPEAMSPRERISRCLDGRARAYHEAYDHFLLELMRPNIGREERNK